MAEKGREKDSNYEYLNDSQVQELRDTAQEQLDVAVEQYKAEFSTRSFSELGKVGRTIKGIEDEMRKRGMIQEAPDTSEEDAAKQESRDDYRTWKEKKSGEDLMKVTNERFDTIREEEGKRAIRKDYKDTDEFWADVEAEKRSFDTKRAVERAKSDQEAEKKAWAEIEKEEVDEEVEKEWGKIEVGEKTFDVHKQAAAEGKVDNFASYEDMYDQAQKDNQDVDKIRDSSEYKAEDALEDKYKTIDSAIDSRLQKVKEFKDRSWFQKLKAPGDRFETYKSGREAGRLQDLRTRLGSEVTKYFEEKKGFQSKLDFFSDNSAEDFSKMGEGGQTSDDYKQIMAEMAIMEDNHKRVLESIQKQLQWEKVNADLEVPDTSKLDSVDSKQRTTDEQLFITEEAEKIDLDPSLQTKISDIEQELDKKKRVKKGSELADAFRKKSSVDVPERDKKREEEAKREIQKVLEEYKQKVLEARLKIRRLTAIIQTEQRADSSKMDMALVQGAAEKIEEESTAIKKYEEQLRRRVKIRAGYKTRFGGHARP